MGSNPYDQIEKGSVIIYCWSQNQLGVQTRGLVELKQGGMVDPKQNKNLVEEQVGGIPIEVGRNGRLGRAQTPEAVEQPAHEKAPHPALMSFSSCGSHNSCSSCHIELVHFQALHCVLSFLSTPHHSGHPCFFHVLTHITSLIILLNNYNVQVNLSGR